SPAASRRRHTALRRSNVAWLDRDATEAAKALATRKESHMDTDHCLVERSGHVLVVTLNRPEAKNALSPGMLAGMYRAWRGLDDDPDLRVAVLTGRGDV